ncbi:carboxymuconolactone decarboxylase family protein, partial [Streptomyces sp. CHD11]|nr:carboxymuconolactone decarboxylase family protein [Streptomyces sp. CHD11]
MSQLRLPFSTLSPAAYQGLIATGQALAQSSLGLELVELIYLRISQINGCAFCLGKHAETLREQGVSQAKLDRLAGWRISELFDARERAALEWAETLTAVADKGA